MAFPSKKEEESGLNSYYNNKTTIIQEARVFNESPISPRKCRALLTRIVYLLYIGETFGTQEATTLFFGTTKLFQHKDVSILSRLSRSRAITKRMRSQECAAAGRVLGNQRTREDLRRRYNGHEQYHEGHAAQFRSHLQIKCNSGTLLYH